MKIESSLETMNKLTQIVDSLWGHKSVKVIFEFGSRYGEDSIEFAKKYPQATIYAFECNPNTISKCRENVSQYPNILLTEKAVSDQNGKVSFYKIDKDKTQTTWSDGNQGASSLLVASGKYPIENYVQEEIVVESVTLSSFIKENEIDIIDVMWVDIQGAELLALKGLETHISKIKIIQLEVEFFEIYQDQPLFEELAAFLSAASFELLGFSSKGEYAGDAVFVNTRFISPEKISKYKKVLAPKKESIKKRIRVFAKRILAFVK